MHFFCCLFATMLLWFSLDATAQPSHYQSQDSLKIRRAKSIYVELFGSSGLNLSANYDMRFRPGNKGWGFRAGMALPFIESRAETYSFPVLLNYVKANGRVAFEAGAGVVAVLRWFSFEDTNNVIKREYLGLQYPATANVGIRFQPVRTGIVWRLYWVPTWRIGSTQRPFTTWLGTSLGIGFH